jgi:hypothetical protein
MQDFTDSPMIGGTQVQPPQRSRALWWLLSGCATVVILGCGGLVAAVAYLGTYGPDTSVYTGNRIPARFLRTMEDVGALESGETILYFYSDAMTDIRNGFYFVSDRKVAIYSQTTGGTPLTAVPFDQIAEAELYRDESFLDDSEITLQLHDGQVLSFPVSSEFDRDQQFFDAIQERIETPSVAENAS